MKKTLVALAIASMSASAFAANDSSQNSKPTFEFDPMHKDQFSVSGSWGVGGYYDTYSEAFYDDWVTALTVAVNYQNNRLLGYLEVDLEMNYNSSESDNDKINAVYGGTVTSGPATDVDKAWLGFDTGYGVLSFGWENDTALDKVDGAGDFTYEFGSSAGDTSDDFNVIKFQGSTSGFAYGISASETSDTRSAADSVYNGYIGVEQETFNLYAGYETRELENDKEYNVTSLSGNVTVADFKLGANFWINDTENDANTGNEETGYYLSAAYPVTPKLTLAVGYTDQSTDYQATGTADTDYNAFNVAAMYTVSDKVDMGIDIKRDLEEKFDNDEQTYVFAAAYYYF
ncbi:porin [Vibrio coralliilyticus]|uniref:porin n=1 Tax=Vibrio coralliilyticus TaxID=190893 RepID=UPI00148BF0A3|nr:porin [Vibrio coralliilyticus]NOI30225.1 porin [Vibrio coralliilyticus]NOI46801.1 porin [Vibrio coralliilyticus]WFB46207.1 porin [Vibrio coralliilyticus]